MPMVAPELHLKGLARVRKTLSNGNTIFYCYAWRGGPLLKTQDGKPIQPGDTDLGVAYDAAHERRRNPKPDSLAGLVTLFRASADFVSKSAETRREYNRYLDTLNLQFGNLSFAELEDKNTRGLFKAWRDGMSCHPRSADYGWATLGRLLAFAVDRGLLAGNVAKRGGRLYRADRREAIWTEDDVAVFEARASDKLRTALLLALWTGQRKGDLLSLTWKSYDGSGFRIRQSKTGRRVYIPAAACVREALSKCARSSSTILTNSRGQSWTAAGFNTSWRKACIAAGIEGLTFHDLRGTAVTRMALAGCSIAEIGAVTGHSPKDIDAILHVHYLGGQRDLARQAIAKWEQMSTAHLSNEK